VTRYSCHPGFTLKPPTIELSSGFVEEPPIEGEGRKFRGNWGDIRGASGSGGGEPGTREVKAPFGSEVEKASPDGIVLRIYAPCSGYCATGDDGIQVEETEDVNRELRGKSCDDVHCSCGEVYVDETGLVVDQFAFLSV
jgi:hypothetical protein